MKTSVLQVFIPNKTKRRSKPLLIYNSLIWLVAETRRQDIKKKENKWIKESVIGSRSTLATVECKEALNQLSPLQEKYQSSALLTARLWDQYLILNLFFCLSFATQLELSVIFICHPFRSSIPLSDGFDTPIGCGKLQSALLSAFFSTLHKFYPNL